MNKYGYSHFYERIIVIFYIFQEFQGALVENYVAQALACQEYGLFYWTSAGQAELDFILQCKDVVYPVEVKSGRSLKKKSLLAYIQKYQPKLAIRISAMNLKLDGNILNCPFYLIDDLTKLLASAISCKRKSNEKKSTAY